MTTQGTLGERVSRFEGSYEHLATKADIAEVKSDIARVAAKIDNLESRLLIRLGELILVASGLVVAILRFWP